MRARNLYKIGVISCSAAELQPIYEIWNFETMFWLWLEAGIVCLVNVVEPNDGTFLLLNAFYDDFSKSS